MSSFPKLAGLLGSVCAGASAFANNTAKVSGRRGRHGRLACPQTSFTGYVVCFHFLIFQAHIGKQCSYIIYEQEGPDMTGLHGQRKIACSVF